MRIFIAICLLLVLSSPLSAQTKPDLNSFGAWPVLHAGRVKTMDSFSRAVFYKIAQTGDVHGVSSLSWLANTIFDPAATINVPFIRMNSAIDILNLPVQDSKYYSMNDIMAAITPHQDLILALDQRDPATLTASQKELMTVYEAVIIYNQLIQSFSAILPLQGDNQSYSEGGGGKEQRQLIKEGGLDNSLLKIIPSDNPSSPLISVWESIDDKGQNPYIDDLKLMAIAWNDSDYETWNILSHKLENQLTANTETSFHLKLEHLYVMISPMFWVMVIYAVGGIILAWKPQYILPKIMIYSGFTIHLVSLIARSYILSRPPTGTLYETLLFGSAIVMLMGLLLMLRGKNQTIFLSLCALSSAFLLFVSRGFIQGDSLSVLVAVLNTNFWLSTHVTCIIIGYAFCVMAAMIGHGVLAFRNPQLEKIMMPMTLAALLFTSVGTLLGGIWADQSWGRFWGWDPKENGALLIVLWLIWILHGRISGHFKPRGFAAALSLTNIMVALTWFGVNLLGVGLHSYGFISGIAWGLGGFIIAQSFTVAILYLRYPKVTYD